MLESEEGVLEDTKDMLEHAVLFYKNLFGFEESLGVKLGEDFWDEGDKVTSQENELLEAPFSEEEIRLAVFESWWLLFYVLPSLLGDYQDRFHEFG